VTKCPLAERRQASAQGQLAYETGDYAACVRLLELAGDAYDAACCHARAGDHDGAFCQLALAAEQASVSSEHLQTDADLTALHDDPRWPELVATLERPPSTVS
jgi:hypothetical protein